MHSPYWYWDVFLPFLSIPQPPLPPTQKKTKQQLGLSKIQVNINYIYNICTYVYHSSHLITQPFFCKYHLSIIYYHFDVLRAIVRSRLEPFNHSQWIQYVLLSIIFIIFGKNFPVSHFVRNSLHYNSLFMLGYIRAVQCTSRMQINERKINALFMAR